MHQEGLKDLGNWLIGHPETRLVVIDTLAMFRSRRQGNYEGDYEEISKLKSLAERHKIALVLVHHSRKGGAADKYDLVRGSTGLTGVVDTVAFLERKRFETDAVLEISSRDQADLQLPLKFDAETGWEVRGKAEEYLLTPERQKIVDVLKKWPFPLPLWVIADVLGKKKSNVANLLASLIRKGIVVKVGYGKYQLKGAVESRRDEEIAKLKKRLDEILRKMRKIE
jgi:hypothetical protein